jgi:hypothetical protein
MTEIKSLYKEYIQKSRIFLYPLLNIPRGVSVTPIQTYMEWEGVYTIDDCKLIALYHLRDDHEFKKFEEVKLLNNKRFDEFFELDDKQGAYIFDFKDQNFNYKRIVDGEYSQLSARYKHKILDFFKNHRAHHAYIESYLYPDKYFTMYSDLLNVNTKILKQVGELCSKPNFYEESDDITTEILHAEIKIMNFDSINLNLPDKPTE